MLILVILLALVGVGSVLAQSSIYLYNLTLPQPGLTNTCVNTLNQAIACPGIIKAAGQGNYFEDEDTLSSICGTGCTNAISTYARRVNQTCPTGRIQAGNNMVHVAYLAQELLEKQARLCLKNPYVLEYS